MRQLASPGPRIFARWERHAVTDSTEPTVSEIFRYGLSHDLTIIDFHTHLGRWFHYWFSEDSAHQLVARMDDFGITTSITHHTLGMVGEYRRGNDIIGQAMRRFPGRIEGAAMANPHYPQEIRPELQRCLDEYDMRVIKLHPSTHAYKLDGDGYQPVYEFASDHGLIVVTHCGANAENGSAMQLASMAARYPDTTFVAYHVAGDFESLKIYGEAVRPYPNYYVEICGPMTHNVLEMLVDEVGEDKVLFGSDHIFMSMPPGIGRVASCRLSEVQKRKLLGLNAKRLLDRLRGPSD